MCSHWYSVQSLTRKIRSHLISITKVKLKKSSLYLLTWTNEDFVSLSGNKHWVVWNKSKAPVWMFSQRIYNSPLQVSLCFNAAVHQQAHQTFTRCLPNTAMPLLGGQLSGAWHGAISGSLGRLRWWRRLTGFVRLLLPWLAFGFSEDGDE